MPMEVKRLSIIFAGNPKFFTVAFSTIIVHPTGHANQHLTGIKKQKLSPRHLLSFFPQN
jgi:hypothetical protein